MQQVVNSNLGPILLRFRDIEGFLLRRVTPLLFPGILGMFHCSPWTRLWCWGSEDRRVKLINRVITVKLIQLIWPLHITSTSWTDGQTDGRLTIAIPRSAVHMHRAVKIATRPDPYLQVKRGLHSQKVSRAAERSISMQI